jgi:hypothetical protein
MDAAMDLARVAPEETASVVREFVTADAGAATAA